MLNESVKALTTVAAVDGGKEGYVKKYVLSLEWKSEGMTDGDCGEDVTFYFYFCAVLVFHITARHFYDISATIS